jgi:hypothetical protein
MELYTLPATPSTFTVKAKDNNDLYRVSIGRGDMAP